MQQIIPQVIKNKNNEIHTLTEKIDIIERLAEGTYFNFFSVALQHNAPTLIRILNEN